jgi:hypothetical protein
MLDINRKLGIVPVGTPDMNPLYSASVAIDSGINTFKITSIRNTSNISDQFNIFSKQNIINFNSTDLPSDFSLKQSFTGNIGRSVATSKDGTVFVIGNQFGNGCEIYTGNYQLGWRLKQSLINNTFSGSMGSSVSINTSGTVVVMGGSSFNHPNTGITLIYTGSAQSNWVLKQVLTGLNSGDGFGESLTINNSKNVLTIGSPSPIGDLFFLATRNNNGMLWTARRGVGPILVVHYYRPGMPAATCVIESQEPGRVAVGHGPNTTRQQIIDCLNTTNFVTASLLEGFNGSTILNFTYGDTLTSSQSSIGGVSIYTGTSEFGWKLKQRINISSGSGERYGTSVEMNNDATVLMMGGPSDSYPPEGGIIFGGALVYTGDTQLGWKFKQKLSADSVADQFGTSVATNKDGTVLAMGGIYDAPNDPGSVMVFTGNSQIGWGLKQKLIGDSLNDRYGASVSINDLGSVIVMGGPFDDDGGNNAGAAIVYSGTPENGWQPMQKITGNRTDNRLGFSTAINNDGTMILIGGSNGISGQAVVYTGNFLDNLYQINPNNENIVEVGTEPLIIKVSGAWSGNGVKWEASKDKINWTGFNLRENFNLTGQTSLTNSGVFVFSGNIPNGYPYLRLQNLRNKINLITDTRIEESARTRTSWTPPNYTSSGTIYGNLIYYSPDNSNFESEWPKPCEYYNSEILAYEYWDEITETGVSVTNLFNSLINNTGNSIFDVNILNENFSLRYMTGTFLTGSNTYSAFGHVINKDNIISEKISGSFTSINPIIGFYSWASGSGINNIYVNTENFDYVLEPIGSNNFKITKSLTKKGCVN